MPMTVFALFFASVLVAAPEVDQKPNVIVIMTDDLGVAELGCTGSTKIRTPHIDALREQGMLFTNAYSGSTVCAPSRCTLLTGKHTGHAQIRDNGESPNFSGPPEDPATKKLGGWTVPPEPNGLWGGQRGLEAGTETIARALQRSGYATCGIGKWGLGGPGSTGLPNDQGFDHWFGYLCQRNAHNYYPTYLVRNKERVGLDGNDRGFTGKQYATDLMADEAVDFIQSHADEPFFIYFATPVPHLALQVPDDSLAEYSGQWVDPPYEGGRGYLAHPEPRAAYAAMVTRFDRDVGRMVDTLRELDLWDNTVILLTSDNGSTFDLGGYDPEFFDGTGGLRGAKTYLYEGGIRVPFIATWPGHIAADSTSDELIGNWDIFPTVLGLTHSTTQAELDGVNLAPVLLGTGEPTEREGLYWEFHSRGGMQAARLGDWKGLRLGAHADANAPLELYNLASDPNETTNVAAEHPDIVQKMNTFMAQSRTPSPVRTWNFGVKARRDIGSFVDVDSAEIRRWRGKGDERQFLDPDNWSAPKDAEKGRDARVYVIANDATVVGGPNGCEAIDVDGGMVIVQGGQITGNGRGFSNGHLRIDGGSVSRQFVRNAQIVLAGDGVLRLYGGANPINRSMIDLQSDEARLELVGESAADATREHLSKVTVRGEPAVLTENIIVEDDGRGGSVLRVQVAE